MTESALTSKTHLGDRAKLCPFHTVLRFPSMGIKLFSFSAYTALIDSSYLPLNVYYHLPFTILICVRETTCQRRASDSGSEFLGFSNPHFHKMCITNPVCATGY